MAPRSANDTDIAIVAWQHVYKFNVSGDLKLMVNNETLIDTKNGLENDKLINLYLENNA